MVWVRDAHGKRRYVPQGTDLETLASNDKGETWHKFNTIVADKIVELHMQGNSLDAISKEKGFPPVKIIYHWIQHNITFKNKIMQARQMRGFYFENKVMAEAEAVDADNYNAQRVKIDAAKWLAKVNNPDVFGEKTKISGDKDAPLTFVVDTGIRREEDEQKIVEAEVVPALEQKSE